MQGMNYRRLATSGLRRSTHAADIFADWRGPEERWMFVSPHDDDIVIGAGITFQAGIVEGARVDAVVVSDGRMGYCRGEHRASISAIRKAEAERSFALLGLPAERLHFLGFPDGDLYHHRGRRSGGSNGDVLVLGGSGLQNSFTHVLREVRPTRLFLATSADLHPDHRIVHEEFLISLFHAQGNIWPELGQPLAEVPKVYEFACYCDFPEPPQIRVDAPVELLEKKLAGIAAYASQEQIGVVVDIQRAAGPTEYLRELNFRFYSPQQYAPRFEEDA